MSLPSSRWAYQAADEPTKQQMNLPSSRWAYQAADEPTEQLTSPLKKTSLLPSSWCAHRAEVLYKSLWSNIPAAYAADEPTEHHPYEPTEQLMSLPNSIHMSLPSSWWAYRTASTWAHRAVDEPTEQHPYEPTEQRMSLPSNRSLTTRCSSLCHFFSILVFFLSVSRDGSCWNRHLKHVTCFSWLYMFIQNYSIQNPKL